MNLHFLKIIFLGILIPITLWAGIIPEYDKNCDFLKTTTCEVDKFLSLENIDYYKKEVPRKIHRIWFGDQNRLSKEDRRSWEEYALRYAYEYKLWTEKDFVICTEFMKAENYELMQLMISQQNWWAASDILRIELIKNFGGIYLDSDFKTPSWEGHPIDFFRILNNKGLTLMTEHCGRDIGTQTAIFVANGFIVAPPNHPVIVSAVEQLHANALNFYNSKGYFDAAYATGPFLLNRVLSGTYNIVPCMYLKKFKIYE